MIIAYHISEIMPIITVTQRIIGTFTNVMGWLKFYHSNTSLI